MFRVSRDIFRNFLTCFGRLVSANRVVFSSWGVLRVEDVCCRQCRMRVQGLGANAGRMLRRVK